MTPFPKDDDFDYNPEIDRMIEDRLFGYSEPDYFYPYKEEGNLDREYEGPDDLEGVL